MTPRVALTIAGSDSGGGAGLQADLMTFAALGVFGTSAVTAVTAQNTVGVRAVTAMAPSVVVAQIAAVLDDLHPVAVKTGMLANESILAAVGGLAAQGLLPRLVVDPVLVATSGDPLMTEGGVDAYRRLLLPHALVATPNLAEAAVLTDRTPSSLTSTESMTEVAEELRTLGPSFVVVKGGHRTNAHAVVDVVACAEGVFLLPANHVATRNDHGTGCSLAAAITAGLALGQPVLDAIETATRYVHRALQGAANWNLGSGRGPIDHFGWSSARTTPTEER